MSRYGALRVLACALVLVLAGCAGSLPVGSQPDGTPTAATPTLAEPAVHSGLTAGLTLYTHQPVHATVTELGPGGRGVVVDRTYADQPIVEFGDGPTFRENGDYRVVLEVNGTVRWTETIRHYEYYELRVVENGSVEVEGHSTA